MRIGIYGGAFDPIHVGHINPILEIVQKHKLEKVHFIPTHISNSKKKIEATSEERLIMAKKSIEDMANFIVDDREIKRGGKSYTHESIKDISIENPKAKLYCIIGDDLLKTIDSWKSFEEIIKFTTEWYKFNFEQPKTDMYSFGVKQIQQYQDLAVKNNCSWIEN